MSKAKVTAAVVSAVVLAAWGFIYSERIEVDAPPFVEISVSGFAYTKPVVCESESNVESRGQAQAISPVSAVAVDQPFDDLTIISKSSTLEVDLFPEYGIKIIHEALPELSSNMIIEGDGDSAVIVYAGPFSKNIASGLSTKYFKPMFADESSQWNVLLGAFDNVDSAKRYAKSCAEYLRSSRVTWAYRDDVLEGGFVKLRFFNLSEVQNKAVRDFVLKKYSSVVPVLITASKVNN